ncbi:MAG TPA: hypothetical protein DDW52_18560 [Planctomycetaceae bacterium]|nr:hypothetical protein [Planctomycetaceae bacterium]
MSEICAYHEAGHAAWAVIRGGRIASISIDPVWEEGPRQDGVVEVEWPPSMSDSDVARSGIEVSLAGPVAEMIYSGDPFHPATMPEWSGDWQTAWNLAASIWKDQKLRLRKLEAITRYLYEQLSDDNLWQAIASLSDELLAHEQMEYDEVHETLLRWLPS